MTWSNRKLVNKLSTTLPIITNIKPRPTKINSADEAFGLNFFQMSMVKRVEPELKVAVREDISAANITARSKPYIVF